MIGICVDPFQTSPSEIKKVVMSLRASFAQKLPLSFLYVSSRADSGLNTAFDVPEKDRYTEYPRGLIQKMLVKAGVKAKPSNVHVVFENTLSKVDVAKRVEKECKRHKIKLVAVYSHKQSRISRFFIGSFTEELMSKTNIKVLVVK
jgi:nucleotide-binding universal stress UspA family protein